MEYKQFDSVSREFAGVEVKSATNGEITAVFSTTGVVDHDGDVTVKGAFESGANARISDWNHSSWNGALPVGRGKIYERGDEAILEGKFFMNTQRGRDAFFTVQGLGELAELSYGFDVERSTSAPRNSPHGPNHRRTLHRLKVHEVSPVLKGAGIGTRVLATKSATTGLTPYQQAIMERARESLFRMDLEDARRRLDDEMHCAELREMRDRFTRDHGVGYSTAKTSAVRSEVRSVARAAVNRYAPGLGLLPEAIEIKYFAEEVTTGARTRHGDPIDGPDFYEFTSDFDVLLKGLTMPTLDPWTIRLNASLPVGEVPYICGHESYHLAHPDAPESAAKEFENQIRRMGY